MITITKCKLGAGLLSVVVAVTVVALSGCPPTGLTGTAILDFINNTSLACTGFYASPSSSSSWGSDVLSSDVPSGTTRRITGIPANTPYDFRADFADGSRATVGGVVFADAQTLSWTVTDGDLTGGGEVDPAILQMELDAHAAVNGERNAEGLASLTMREDLRQVARAHSEDMVARDFFDHVNPDGDDPFDRMADAGITYATAGENIAWNNFSNPVPTAVAGWMASTGHRANILNGRFTLTGMGVASDGAGGYYFTQVFIGLTKDGEETGLVEFHLPPPLAIAE